MKSFKQYLEEEKKKGRCWTGYKPVAGKEPYSPGSCEKVKEETQLDEAGNKPLEPHIGMGDSSTPRQLKTDMSKASTEFVKSAASKKPGMFHSKVAHMQNKLAKSELRKRTNEEVKLDETAAWQRKEGKSESGGLNQKGVDSYRRENPGSKLQTAVTTKPSKLKPGSKAANRRKSFCARMSGMKKRLTSAKTANDPDSRINKSLRKWNC